MSWDPWIGSDGWGPMEEEPWTGTHGWGPTNSNLQRGTHRWDPRVGGRDENPRRTYRGTHRWGGVCDGNPQTRSHQAAASTSSETHRAVSCCPHSVVAASPPPHRIRRVGASPSPRRGPTGPWHHRLPSRDPPGCGITISTLGNHGVVAHPSQTHGTHELVASPSLPLDAWAKSSPSLSQVCGIPRTYGTAATPPRGDSGQDEPGGGTHSPMKPLEMEWKEASSTTSE